MKIKHVLGNTFYFDFPGLSIPFYQLDAGRIILLDGGYARNAGQILEYLHGNEIRIEAILHTHAHPDHINGDHVFLGQFSPDPGIFCSQRDFEFMLGRRRESEKEISEHDEYQSEDNLAYMEALIGKIQDIGDKEAVTICGKTFRLLSSTGHCLQHQAIVTPDDVCYLGDLLLHGKTLAVSKAPYTFQITDDVASKRELSTLHHKAYIAAHDGDFRQEELLPLIDVNVEIFNHILREVARLEEAEPSLEIIDATRELLETIGIHKYADINWVLSTIGQYFEYYQKYHVGEFL